MNETVFIGYDPKCKIYLREQTAGKRSWYIEYYLPNGKRIRRPCSKIKSDAKARLHVTEKHLLEGKFDEKDLKNLEGFSAKYARPLLIDDAVEMYLTSASTGKTAKTQYNDETSSFLNRLVVFSENEQ